LTTCSYLWEAGTYLNFSFALLLLCFGLMSFGLQDSGLAETQTTDVQKFKFELLTEQEDVVWGFDFIDESTILFSQRGGALKTLNLKTKKVVTVKGAPSVWHKGQGGLLDVVVDPSVKNQIFLSYSKPVGKDKGTTAIAKAQLKDSTLVGLEEIFVAKEATDETIHFGSRIVFLNGSLLVTIGERNVREHVQDLGYHTGKVIRINKDGSAVKDNPFSNVKGAMPEIWSFGHRNPQGLAVDPKTSRVWLSEMGPRGGDEINLIVPGKNYGWPDVTYGREYWGPSIGVKEKKGTEQPVVFWVPSISPSGITVYRGTHFSKWDGNIFVACLSGRHVRRLQVEEKPGKGFQVIHQEVLLAQLNERFRMVRTGPDGFLYLATDSGKIARVR